MPKAPRYIKGFGLSRGMIVGAHKLTEITVGHDTIKRFRTYEYPTVMIFDPTVTDPAVELLVNELLKLLQEPKIIDSEYGNPYLCYFGELHVELLSDDRVKISSVGKCNRVFRGDTGSPRPPKFPLKLKKF